MYVIHQVEEVLFLNYQEVLFLVFLITVYIGVSQKMFFFFIQWIFMEPVLYAIILDASTKQSLCYWELMFQCGEQKVSKHQE